MAFSVNTASGSGFTLGRSNLAANIALRGIGTSRADFERSSERLATGQRISRPSDDPSGFIGVNKLRHQIAGRQAAITNNTNSINQLSVAQDGLSAILDRVQKLRSVALKAMGSDIATTDRTSFQDEVDFLLNDIDQIVGNTHIGGNRILNGSGSFRVESTDKAFDNINVTRAKFNGSGEVGVNVGITRLAERATIVTNLDLAADNLTFGGATSLGISGPQGSSQVRITPTTTAQDLKAQINAARDLTGVFASSYIANGAEALVNFADIETDLELTGGNTITFDVSVNGRTSQVTLAASGNRDSDGNPELTADDLEAALNSANLGNFSVISAIDSTGLNPAQNFIIRHAGANDFTLSNFASFGGTIGAGSALNGLTINGTEPAAARIYTDGASITGPATFNLQVVSGGTSTEITKTINNVTAADLNTALNNVATVTSLGVGKNGQEIFSIVADTGIDAFAFRESSAGANDAANLGLLSDTGGGNGLASKGMAVLGLYSEAFGSDQFITLRNAGESATTFAPLNETATNRPGLAVGSGELRAQGVDTLAEINGKRVLGRGHHVVFTDPSITVDFDFAPRFGVGSFTNALNRALGLNYADPMAQNLIGTRPVSQLYDGSTFAVTDTNDAAGKKLAAKGFIDEVGFTVFDFYEGGRARSGLGVQLNDEASGREYIGIRNFDTSSLGGLPSSEGLAGTVNGDIVKGQGSLSQLRRGGSFHMEGDVSRIMEAIDIIDRAQEQILKTQTQIGLYQTRTLQSNRDFLTSQNIEVNNALNDMGSTDIALETTRFLATQTKIQAAASVLAQANSIPQTLLSLLR